MHYQIPPHLSFCTPGQNQWKLYTKTICTTNQNFSNELQMHIKRKEQHLKNQGKQQLLIKCNIQTSEWQVKIKNETKVIEPHK